MVAEKQGSMAEFLADGVDEGVVVFLIELREYPCSTILLGLVEILVGNHTCEVQALFAFLYTWLCRAFI